MEYNDCRRSLYRNIIYRREIAIRLATCAKQYSNYLWGIRFICIALTFCFLLLFHLVLRGNVYQDLGRIPAKGDRAEKKCIQVCIIGSEEIALKKSCKVFQTDQVFVLILFALIEPINNWIDPMLIPFIKKPMTHSCVKGNFLYTC